MGRAQSRLSAFTLCVQLGLLHFHANLHVLGTEFQRPFDEVRNCQDIHTYIYVYIYIRIFVCVQLGLLHFHANLHVLGTEFQRPFDEVRTASSKVLIRHEQEVMS